ncbi:hypothetical protein NMY22_g10225 [Coprinellus aureogranulatus]|nr:hypothetical protein NMY22_g10225 [Coprinellus aureogranulatus]
MASSTSGPITVDDTHPDIKYSPRGLWKQNDVCIACNVGPGGRSSLRKQAFNSTWHAAPGAQFNPKDGMSIDFTFTGSNAIAMFVFFRRTNNRGRTRNDGKANLVFKLDDNEPQRLPLTLEGWTNQELRQKFRMSQFLVNSPKEGNHTLNIQLARDDAIDVPVTFALDYIRFTPSSTNVNTGGSAPRPSITPDPIPPEIPVTTEVTSATLALDETSTLIPTPSSESASSGAAKGKTDVGKIVGPVVGLFLAVIALVTLLLCWRQRRIKKHQRIKRSIRPFRPVMFDRYWQSQEPRFSYYRPETTEKGATTVLPLYSSGQQEEIEKPRLSVSPPPRRVSIARASLDSVPPFLELPSQLTLAKRLSNQHHSFFTDSSFSAHPQSFANETKDPASRKPFVSISSMIEPLPDPTADSQNVVSQKF